MKALLRGSVLGCSGGETDALRAPSAYPQDAAAKVRCATVDTAMTLALSQ